MSCISFVITSKAFIECIFHSFVRTSFFFCVVIVSSVIFFFHFPIEFHVINFSLTKNFISTLIEMIHLSPIQVHRLENVHRYKMDSVQVISKLTPSSLQRVIHHRWSRSRCVSILPAFCNIYSISCCASIWFTASLYTKLSDLCLINESFHIKMLRLKRLTIHFVFACVSHLITRKFIFYIISIFSLVTSKKI